MRRVTTDDADELAALDALLFDNCFNEKTLAHEVAIGLGWVVTDQEKLLAYALVRDDGLVLDLIRLGVHPEHQGRGLGSSLLRTLLQQRRDVILTVRAQNTGALRLYLRHGFKVVGRLCVKEHQSWVLRYFNGLLT